MSGDFSDINEKDATYVFKDVVPSMPWNYVYPHRTFMANELVYPFGFDILKVCMYVCMYVSVKKLGKNKLNQSKIELKMNL